MAPLSSEEREAINEALSQARKKVAFEHTLGKTVRKRGMDFDAYLRLIGEIRDIARKRRISMEESAKALVEDSDQE
jgi:hypothetical protein